VLRGCVTLWCLTQCALAGSLPRADSSWKTYYNPQGHYCVDYLSRWVSGDAFEGAGFYLYPPSRSLTEIDVAVVADRSETSTLPEEVQVHWDGLTRFGLAERIQPLEQHDAQLSGRPALFTKNTYYDPQNHAMMVDEIILSMEAGRLYRLELSSGAEELKRSEPLFQRLVSSFQFDCQPPATRR